KHYGITQQKKAFEQQILELQKKDPSKISATNYNDALIVSGRNEYMNGGIDADLKSPLVYKPYTDYTEAMLKTAEQLQKLAKHRYEYSETELATLPGYEGMIKTTKGYVTEADWLQILPNYITQEMRDQMAIDARAMYGWSDEKAIESRDAQRDSVIVEYQKKIDSLKSTLNQDTAVE